MTSLLALVVLAATLPVAAPGLTSGDVAVQTLQVANDDLAGKLGAHGLPTVSEARITAALGPERATRLVGCVSQACLNELRSALGVEAVLSGSVAHQGEGLLVTLQLTRASDGQPLASFSGTAASMSELPALLSRAAESLAIAAWTKVDEAPEPSQHVGRTVGTAVALVIGIAALVTAAVMWGLSASANDRLSRGDSSLTTGEAFALKNSGQRQQVIAIITTVAGGVAILTTMGLVLSAASDPTPRLVLAPSGLGFSFSGAF